MPAKTPIYLKPANSKKGKKCRLRDILSPDMISPPLGDFRHTIHIGRGGERDAFGDMSFLQGKFELLPGKGETPRPQYGLHGEFLRANSASEASFAETPSPVLKNAISLPSIGGCQALTLPLLSAAVFSLPPRPLVDMVGPTIPMSAAHRSEELEILQMDALLRSMEAFGRDPAPKTKGDQSKPDVLLGVLEQRDTPSTKKATKSNKNHNGENGFEKQSSYYINAGGNGVCYGNVGLRGYGSSNGVHGGNGGFGGNVNVKNICNSNGGFNGKDSANGGFNGNGHSKGTSNANGGFNGNGNCNGYRSFNGDITLCYEKDLSDCTGDRGDRDSGVEEGRISDFDFEFPKETSVSRETLSQITGSLLSLELDLGPSILDDVLDIMDRPVARSRP